MGLAAYFACRGPWVPSGALGDANRGARPLGTRRGEQSRGARRDDPPSDGLFRFSGRLADRIGERGYHRPWMVRKLLLASPRGYCAGVERAVETVERALELYGSPGVRAQADRPQPARRPRSRGARGDLRRGGDRGARGRDGGLLGPRRRADGARERGAAPAEHDRRDVPARHQGARAGAAVRGSRLHGHPDRPCGPRGGRRDDGRGARLDRPRRERRGRRDARPAARREARVHHADDAVGRRDAARSSRRCASGSRRSTRRRRKTSVTPPPTGSGP